MMPPWKTEDDTRKLDPSSAPAATRLRGQPPALRGKPLSPQEAEIVTLVGRTKVNKDIAAALGLTVGTVKVYLVRIFRKTGVTSRTELALWYRNR
jgi:DNA-binding NarL/FixJ family response regulator